MGLDTKATQFLLAARGLGVSLERVATIGRQRLYVTPAWLRARLRAIGIALDSAATARLFEEADGFAEPLLRMLGARRVLSLDASGYEGASRVADLNARIAPDLESAFTTVFDSGSLEHVFDFPTAIGNCMRMVAADGHLLIVTPANNMVGHGFYQFSPELFYRVLAESNGFVIERMLATELSSSRWYQVADPAVLGTRVQFRTFRPTYLCVIARRVAVRPVLVSPPQQSDYVTQWQNTGRTARGVAGADLHPLDRYLPHWLATVTKSCGHLGQVLLRPFDPKAFKRVDIARLATGGGATPPSGRTP
ncbi:MAG: hypothetical protein F4Z04_11630 [Acidobacteria bacterium]|nr:hypothetical protein [Acidobacteriota bacterium]